jgi:hypothetical protein
MGAYAAPLAPPLRIAPTAAASISYSKTPGRPASMACLTAAAERAPFRRRISISSGVLTARRPSMAGAMSTNSICG